MFKNKKNILLPTWKDWETTLLDEVHWKEGRSAMLMAQAWALSKGLPWRVRSALEKEPFFLGMEMEEGIVEFPVSLKGRGGSSATDLLVVATRGPDNRIVLAVEGKVDEGFGLTCGVWLQSGKSDNSQANRQARLDDLANVFGLASDDLEDIQYQLIHRTYAAISAAQQKEASVGVMVVHSFLPDHQAEGTGWSEFVDFCNVLRLGLVKPDLPLFVGTFKGVDLWMLWVTDAGGRT